MERSNNELESRIRNLESAMFRQINVLESLNQSINELKAIVSERCGQNYPCVENSKNTDSKLVKFVPDKRQRSLEKVNDFSRSLPPLFVKPVAVDKDDTVNIEVTKSVCWLYYVFISCNRFLQKLLLCLMKSLVKTKGSKQTIVL